MVRIDNQPTDPAGILMKGCIINEYADVIIMK